MKLVKKYLVDLSDRTNKDRLGHVSYYIKQNGEEHRVFFIEKRYFGADTLSHNGEVVRSDRSIGDYDYKLDIYFNEKSRRMPFVL